MGHVITFDHPILMQPFLPIPHNLLKKRNKKTFFLSFTDALICIFKEYGFTKDDVILVPDFYCPVTIETISAHMKVVSYPVNYDLQHDSASYIQTIKNLHPKVILNYTLGEFSLSKEEKALLASLPDDTVIIDDFAHRILTDSQIQPLTKNHFYIDSIRKYSPFLGSHVVNELFSFNKGDTVGQSFHRFQIQLLQFMMDLINIVALTFSVTRLSDLSIKLYEKQDEILSDIRKPSIGGWLSYYMWNYLDLEKIKAHRSNLVKTFIKYMAGMEPHISIPHMHESYYGEMIFFPLLIRSDLRSGLIDYLGSRGIYSEQLWFFREDLEVKLNKQLFDTFFILPLTTHMSVDDVKIICALTKQFIEETHI